MFVALILFFYQEALIFFRQGHQNLKLNGDFQWAVQNQFMTEKSLKKVSEKYVRTINYNLYLGKFDIL